MMRRKLRGPAVAILLGALTFGAVGHRWEHVHEDLAGGHQHTVECLLQSLSLSDPPRSEQASTIHDSCQLCVLLSQLRVNNPAISRMPAYVDLPEEESLGFLPTVVHLEQAPIRPSGSRAPPCA